MKNYSTASSYYQKLISLLMCFLVLFGQSYPLYASIVSDKAASSANQASVRTSPNGVPLIDIVAPNQPGISHNKYSDFNVGESGVVLNNSVDIGRSDLGGLQPANSNLVNSGPAKLIINEVTSSKVSNLDGFVEVHGPAADVIFANPNGVNINGAGFVNIPKVVITTGVPEFDGSGAYLGLNIDGGVVEIGSRGLNAEASSAEILSRAIKVNGDISAKSLKLVTGRNHYDSLSDKITPKPDDGSERPTLALDASELGSMYAGRIYLIGTEEGVGVHVAADLVSSVGDLVASNTGSVELSGDVAVAGNLSALADSDRLTLGGDISVSGDATFEAESFIVSEGSQFGSEGNLAVDVSEQVSVFGSLNSSESMRFDTQSLEVDGGTISTKDYIDLVADDVRLENGALISSGVDLEDNSLNNVSAHLSISANSDVYLSSETVIQSAGTLSVYSENFQAASDSIIITGADANFTGGYWEVNGSVKSAGSLDFIVDSVIFRGNVVSQGDANLVVEDGVSIFETGEVQSNGNLAVTFNGSLDNEGGLLFASKDLEIRGSRLIIDGGALVAVGDVKIEGVTAGISMTELNNSSGAIISQQGDISIDTVVLINSSEDQLVERDIEYHFKFKQSQPPYVHNKGSAYVLGDGYRQLYDKGLTRSYVFVPNPDALLDILADKGRSLDEFEVSHDEGDTLKKYVFEVSDWESILPDDLPSFDPDQWSIMVPDEAQHAPSGSAFILRIDDFALPETTSRAQIVASEGSLNINAGSILNDVGTLSAAKDLDINADTLASLGVGFSKTLTQLVDYNNRTGIRVMGWNRDGYMARVNELLIRSEKAESLRGEIFAGGDLNIFLTHDWNVLSEDASDLGAIKEPTGDNLILFEGLIERNVLAPIPVNSGLFLLAPNTSQFVYETRLSFIDLGLFYGSEYFLRNVLGDYDPDELSRRLGDAYYDTYFILEQITQTTGLRYITEGVSSDIEQVKLLLDNGIAAARELSITPGVALTVEQQKQLIKPIVWYELREVNGKMVNAPRLYIPASEKLYSGSNAGSGGDMNIRAEEVNLVDSSATANERLRIFSEDDIIISDAKVEGKQAVEIDSGGDVTAVRKTLETGGQDGSRGTIVKGPTSIGSEAGSVSIQSEGRVTLNGVDLQAADGNIVLDAKEIVLGVVEATRASQGVDSLGGHYEGREVKYFGSTFRAGNNIILIAQKDVNLTSAELDAGVDIDIKSITGEIFLDSVADSSYSYYRSDSRNNLSEKITHTPSILNAGRDIVIQADNGDVVLVGAELSAEAGISIDGENLELKTTKDRSFIQNQRFKSDAVWYKNQDKGHEHEALNHVLLKTKGDISIRYNGKVVIEYKQTGDLDSDIEQLSQLSGLEWMADLRESEAISEQDWVAMSEVHREWSDTQEGLSGPAAAVITIAIMIVSQQYQLGAHLLALEGAASAAAANAGFATLLSKASISTINNKGDIAAVFDELETSDTLRDIVSSALKAYVLDQIGIEDNQLAEDGKIQESLMDSIQDHLVSVGVSTAVDGVVQDERLGRLLVQNLRNASSALLTEQVSQEIGAAYRENENRAFQLISHYALGYTAAELSGNDGNIGGIGQLAGEGVALIYKSVFAHELAEELHDLHRSGEIDEAVLQEKVFEWKANGANLAKITGGLVAVVAGGSSEDVFQASEQAGAAAENNAFWFAAIPIVIKAAQLFSYGLAAFDAYNLAEAIYEGDYDSAEEFAIEMVAEFGIGKVLGKFEFGSEAYSKLTKILKDKGYADSIDAFESSLKATNRGGAGGAPLDYFDNQFSRTIPVRHAVPSNIGTKIHPSAQGKHIQGHNNFISGKSYLNQDVNAQALLDGVHRGNFPTVGTGSRGQPIIDFGSPIGVDARSGLSTQFGTIHSSKKGVHIVPTNPNTIP